MIIIDGSGGFIELTGNESRVGFNHAATDLALAFHLNGWKWGGLAPDRDDIVWKMSVLMRDAVTTAATTDDGYHAVSSGRIRCEVRRTGRPEDGRYVATFHVFYIVG